jgi:hypothetical protein
VGGRGGVGHKVGHSGGGGAGHTGVGGGEEGAPWSSIGADMARALADGLARAIAAGDGRAARIALAAPGAMVAEMPEGSDSRR